MLLNFNFFSGYPGSIPDKTLWSECSLLKAIQNGTFCNGPKALLQDTVYSEWIMADSGFVNSNYSITPIDLVGRPYGLSKAELRFNYCISRMRVKVEIAIGSLK